MYLSLMYKKMDIILIKRVRKFKYKTNYSTLKKIKFHCCNVQCFSIKLKGYKYLGKQKTQRLKTRPIP